MCRGTGQNHRMRPSKALIGLMLFASIGAPAAAWADEPAAGDGPALKLSGSFLYDSNVSRSSEQAALQRGLTQADEIYTVLAIVDYARDFGSGSAYVTGNAGYAFYQNNTILNREHIDGEAGFRQRFGDCSVLLRGNYLRQQSDLAEIDITTVSRNTQTLPVVSFNVSCNQVTGFSPYADVSQAWSDNSSLQIRPSNYRSLTADAGVAYRQPEIGELDLFAQYSGTDFPDRQVLVAMPLRLVNDSYVVNGGGARLSHNFGPKLETSFTLRYTQLHPRSALAPQFSGLTYEADVTYQPTTRLQFVLSASRSTNPSNQVGTAYSINENYSASAFYTISSRIKFSLAGRWANQDYAGDFLPGSDVINSQTIKSVSGYLSYDFSRNLSVNLNAAHEERSANIATFNYASTRVGVSVSAAF